MKTFKIDPSTGDMMLDAQNKIIMVDGDEAIIQKLERTITTNLNEWFLDPALGFDRFRVLGEEHDRGRTATLLYDAILQVKEIESIETLEFDVDKFTRSLKIYAQLFKQNGDLLEVDFNANRIRF